MAFNGSGVFLRLRSWIADATAGVKVRADFHDDEDNNFAAGLSQCIVKDGQTTITQNIPFNSKRVTALSDPVDPQDAATKAYADTKVAKVGAGSIAGDLTVTGNTVITGNLDVGGVALAHGYKVRRGLDGPYGSTFFNFDWKASNIEAWIDNTFIGNIATQAFVNAADATKLPIAGGTITGGLTVNGQLVATQNFLSFGAFNSPGYIMWNGGSTYTLGGGGTVWHSGNLNPATLGTISNGQFIIAGDFIAIGNNLNEPFNGAVVSMATIHTASGSVWTRSRYLQLYTTNWFTVRYG